jgi:hypothetical protein
MASLPRVIDIEDKPDLLRLVEEVRDTQDELVIREEGEEIAILSPVQPRHRTKERREITEADIEAARSAAGSWKGLIDADKFIEEVYERRKAWFRSRPPVEL